MTENFTELEKDKTPDAKDPQIENNVNKKNKFLLLIVRIKNIKDKKREFPGSPVVRTQNFHCRGQGLDPWSGN